MLAKPKAHADRIWILVKGPKALLKETMVIAEVNLDETWLEFFQRKRDFRPIRNGEIVVKSSHFNVKRQTGWCVTDLKQTVRDFMSKYRRPRNPPLVNISRVKVTDKVAFPPRNANVTPAVVPRKSQRLSEAKLNRDSVRKVCSTCPTEYAMKKGSKRQNRTSVDAMKGQPQAKPKPQIPTTSRSFTTPKKILSASDTKGQPQNEPEPQIPCTSRSLTTPKRIPLASDTKKTRYENRPRASSALYLFEGRKVEILENMKYKDYEVVTVTSTDESADESANEHEEEQEQWSLDGNDGMSMVSSVNNADIDEMEKMEAQGVKLDLFKDGRILKTNLYQEARQEFHSFKKQHGDLWHSIQTRAPKLAELVDDFLPSEE